MSNVGAKKLAKVKLVQWRVILKNYDGKRARRDQQLIFCPGGVEPKNQREQSDEK